MRTLALLGLFALTALSSTAEAVPAPAPQVFSLRPDPRMCPSPMCGGWWISRVNHAQMRCADGTTAQACYVAEVDWSGLGLSAQDEAHLQSEAAAERVLVRGRPYLVTFGGMQLGGLAATQAWIEFP